MKNDNRTIVRWITLHNGVHVPLYEGQTEADATKNLEEYMKGKQGKKTYRDILAEKDIWEATGQFAADTHIAVMEDVINEVDDESLTQVYDTLREIKERYGALDVKTIKLYNEETVEDCDPEAFAAMGEDGTLYVNSIYFSNRPDDITELYQESVNDGFHPKCPDGIAGIITHEVGHMEFFQWLKTANKELGGSNNDYNAIYRWMSGSSNEVSGNEPLFKEFYPRLRAIEEKIQNNAEMKKAWGRKPSMSLQALSDPGKGVKGISISKYASYSTFEMMAEAFADVFWNGKNAALISTMLYKEFYKKKR